MAAAIPGTTGADSNTEDIVQAILQVRLKEREIKILKGVIENMQQEMKIKDEKMAQFQKENQALQERVDKLKITLKGKGL